MWLLDGLEQNRFAILAKTHHALWDGVTGADLHAVLLDTSPEPSETAAEAWTPGAQPSRARLLLDGIRERATESGTFAGAVARALRKPADVVRQARDFTEGAAAYANAAVRPAPASPLNSPTGSRRRFELVRSSLADFKHIGRAFDSTVNDVVLAVVPGAIRRWLVYRDIRPTDLRVMVPVSVRTKAQRGVPGNRVVMFIVPLPVGLADPVRRLETIHETMVRQKTSKQAQAEDLITSVAGIAPPQVVAQLTRLQSVGRLFNFLATNVPGPQFPLYLRGRRLLELFPQAPLAADQALAIAVMSYDGNMGFGLLADRDAIPDVDVIARGIRASVDELMQASEVEDAVPIPISSGVPATVGFP
jgi:WS/DGAT/MGAT family acyltransferase